LYEDAGEDEDEGEDEGDKIALRMYNTVL